MNKADLYPDLVDIVKGSTWKKLFDWFYQAGILRYATREHLNTLSGQFGTKKKIAKLLDNSYLTAVNNGKTYLTTEKTKQILKAEGYNIRIFPKNLTGEGTGHELKVSDLLVKIMKEPHFYAAFYYDFGFLRPDSIVILKKDHAYKITMLEVEQEKKDWLEYLKDKRDKYDQLAKDEEIYSKWWKVWSEKLGLPYCKQDKFCFSVLTNKKVDWEGWNYEKAEHV